MADTGSGSPEVKISPVDIPKAEISTPPSSPVAKSPAGGTAYSFKGMMSYAERRLSQQGLGLGFDSGRRRTSSFGTYSRIVLVAVDSSDHSKNAFDCECTTVFYMRDCSINQVH